MARIESTDKILLDYDECVEGGFVDVGEYVNRLSNRSYALEKVLMELVECKIIKDQGRADHVETNYRERKDAAWDKAKELLELKG